DLTLKHSSSTPPLTHTLKHTHTNTSRQAHTHTHIHTHTHRYKHTQAGRQPHTHTHVTQHCSYPHGYTPQMPNLSHVIGFSQAQRNVKLIMIFFCEFELVSTLTEN